MGTKTARRASTLRSTKSASHEVAPTVDEREFVLKFAGRPDEISAATFLESLSGITSVVQEANLKLGTGEPLDIKIKAPRPGSFLVNLVLDPQATDHVANLFGIGGGLVGALVAVVKLWRFLKGSPPASVEERPENTVAITNEAGNLIIEDQKIANFVISNSNVTFNLARTFAALEGDSSVTAIEILDKSQEAQLAVVPRAEFAQLAIAPEPTKDHKRDFMVRTLVTIVKPSFDQRLRWEIVYSGNRVGAIVTDKKFYEVIDRGEKFSKGDTLDVTLSIKQEYDKTLKAFMNKQYEIIAVHAHILAAQQTGMFDS